MARVLILIAESTSSGIFDYARCRMLEEGLDVTVAAPVKKPIRTVVVVPGGFDGTWDTFEQLPGLIVQPDASVDEINPVGFDAFIVPGGPGPELLRVDSRCVNIARHFVESNKPIAAMCHGPLLITQALVAAGMKGKRISAQTVLKADVIAAGCTWVHTPGSAVVDGNLVTAWRRPDYDVWMGAFVSLLKERGIRP